MTQKVDQAIARSVELGGTVVMIPHATKEDLDYARSIRIDGTMAGYSAQDRGVSTHWGRSNGSVWFIGLVVRDPQELLAQVESITRERDQLLAGLRKVEAEKNGLRSVLFDLARAVRPNGEMIDPQDGAIELLTSERERLREALIEAGRAAGAVRALAARRAEARRMQSTSEARS